MISKSEYQALLNISKALIAELEPLKSSLKSLSFIEKLLKTHIHIKINTWLQNIWPSGLSTPKIDYLFLYIFDIFRVKFFWFFEHNIFSSKSLNLKVLKKRKKFTYHENVSINHATQTIKGQQ